MQPPWSWIDPEPSLLIGTLAACLSFSLLLWLWACTEGSITSAPWIPRRLPHRLGIDGCVAGAQRQGPCCVQRPILNHSGRRAHLHLYCYITAVLSVGGFGSLCVHHPQWRGFVASAVPALWKKPHHLPSVSLRRWRGAWCIDATPGCRHSSCTSLPGC